MGPGLLESVYQQCLKKEPELRGISVAPLLPIPLLYKGYMLNKEYVIDLLVEDEVIVELKAVELIIPVHDAQLISYLRLANKELGYLSTSMSQN